MQSIVGSFTNDSHGQPDAGEQEDVSGEVDQEDASREAFQTQEPDLDYDEDDGANQRCFKYLNQIRDGDVAPHPSE